MLTRSRPEDDRYAVADMPTYILAGLVRAARQRGLACEDWFAGTGLSAQASFDADVRMSHRQAATIIRRAVRAHPQAGLGLAVGALATMSSFGVLGLAVLSCRTLADALRLGCDYHRVSGGLVEPVFEVHGSEGWISAQPPYREPDIEPFLCEELFACLYAAAQALSNGEFRPSRIELSYAAPPYAAAYRRHFTCPVVFDCSVSRMVADAQWLARRIDTYNPITLAHAVRLCEEQVRGLQPQQDLVSSIRLWLRARLQQPADMRAAAQALNLSERSLRRRLSEVGLSFRQLHEDVRRDASIDLIRSGASIGVVAERIGFRDAREFRRAFKRWTGQAPTQYRALRTDDQGR